MTAHGRLLQTGCKTVTPALSPPAAVTALQRHGPTKNYLIYSHPAFPWVSGPGPAVLQNIFVRKYAVLKYRS
ncbi:MAG: hypothetical protein DRH32_00850 [Deltaproteobacteria bacterium]|nr:MAG: hypothetical protein DRH32_00850 [Deltaproteobacteria bacterium]